MAEIAQKRLFTWKHIDAASDLDRLLDELAELLPDLGRKTAGDSKAIPSFGRPVRDEKKEREPDGRRDTDADRGAKTYKGGHKDGPLSGDFCGHLHFCTRQAGRSRAISSERRAGRWRSR